MAELFSLQYYKILNRIAGNCNYKYQQTKLKSRPPVRAFKSGIPLVKSYIVSSTFAAVCYGIMILKLP
jgi:hypothetical protein